MRATVRRTLAQFTEHRMTDWAAALTYYGLLSLFPALIALVSVVGLFVDQQAATRTITDILDRLAPGKDTTPFTGAIDSVTAHRPTSGILFVIGFATALWAASSYVGAFIRASNVAWGTPQRRGFLRMRPLQLLVTLLMILLFAALVLAILLTGPLVDAVAGALGIGSTAVTVWNIVKWPVLAGIGLTMFSVLYRYAASAKLRFRGVAPGAAVALALWVVASAGFGIYVANFGSYDKTYGALGGVVALLVWFWITNCALLLGLELNVQLASPDQ